jgi:hypothetical protein
LSTLFTLLGSVSRPRNQLRFEVVARAGRRSRPTRKGEEAMYIGGGVLAAIIIIILLIWLL